MASTYEYRNCSLLPSEVTDRIYIFEENEEFFYPENDGKWMAFCKVFDELDASWVKAKEAYRAGQLKGVASLKTSTSMKNPRADGHNFFKQWGVISFHCGPSNDEKAMYAIASLIEKYVPCSHTTLIYKSDKQSAMGTRTTGQTKNHLYVYPLNNSQNSTASSHSDDRSLSNHRVPVVLKRGPQSNAFDYPSRDGTTQDIDGSTNWRVSSCSTADWGGSCTPSPSSFNHDSRVRDTLTPRKKLTVSSAQPDVPTLNKRVEDHEEESAVCTRPNSSKSTGSYHLNNNNNNNNNNGTGRNNNRFKRFQKEDSPLQWRRAPA